MNILPSTSTSLGALLTAALLLPLAGCGDKAVAPRAPQAPAAAAKPADPMEVSVRPQMAGYFKFGRIELTDLQQFQEVSGRIEPNERLIARIGASVSGRVTEVFASVGDRVRNGQPLAELASPELTTAQMAYLRAYAASTQAERSVDRARQLLQADVIGSAELQRRESELSLARAEFRAAGDQLALMGFGGEAMALLSTAGTLNPRVSIPATLSGVVIERKISKGQVAQPGDPLFTVADLGIVWVVGALPEQTARDVQTGQSVEIEVPALRNRKLSGQIIYVGDTVSAETRTVEIRSQVDNTQRELKPQMLASMRIRSGSQRVLAVPIEAVVRENDRDHVFVRVAADRFRLVPVELGQASGALRPLLRGAKAGTEIVVEGAFHMNNERKRAELE